MTETVLTETAILEALRQVIDPEIGCNIVDLGLIYDVAIERGSDASSPQNHARSAEMMRRGAAATIVRVKMTLTTPGCPMHESISWGVKNALLNLEGVSDAEVEVVWDPPWHPSMMSEQGRIAVRLRES